MYGEEFSLVTAETPLIKIEQLLNFKIATANSSARNKLCDLVQSTHYPGMNQERKEKAFGNSTIITLINKLEAQRFFGILGNVGKEVWKECSSAGEYGVAKTILGQLSAKGISRVEYADKVILDPFKLNNLQIQEIMDEESRLSSLTKKMKKYCETPMIIGDQLRKPTGFELKIINYMMGGLLRLETTPGFLKQIWTPRVILEFEDFLDANLYGQLRAKVHYHRNILAKVPHMGLIKDFFQAIKDEPDKTIEVAKLIINTKR